MARRQERGVRSKSRKEGNEKGRLEERRRGIEREACGRGWSKLREKFLIRLGHSLYIGYFNRVVGRGKKGEGMNDEGAVSAIRRQQDCQLTSDALDPPKQQVTRYALTKM